jgi:probable HAF family extracellular repeat protein
MSKNLSLSSVSSSILCSAIEPPRFQNGLKHAALFVLFSFLVVGAGQSALGQGIKVAAINPPGAKAGYTVPTGVNTTLEVVGSYIVSSTGFRQGFLYSANKYTVIKPPSDYQFARANGINASGEIVGDFLTSNGRYHGFTYSGGTYTTYNETSTESCGIFGVNSAGDFVGDVGNGPVRAFVNIGGTKTEFYASGADSTYAYGINASNEVVGAYYDSSNNAHGFTWVGGVITFVNYPGATQTSLVGINDAGEITGTYTNTSGLTYGFTLIKGVFASTDFANTGGVNSSGAYVGFNWGVDGVASGYLATPHTFALAESKIKGSQQGAFTGVNNAGVTVGTYVDSTGAQHGMMDNNGTITNIDDPKQATGTVCRGINSSNQIVGNYYDSSNNPHGFLYSAGTFTDITGPSPAPVSEATGINDSGDIVGDYYDLTTGTFHGFLLKGGIYTEFTPTGATATFGGGINDTDELSFWWVDATGYVQSSFWNGTALTTVNVPGIAQSYALGMNKTGEIAYLVVDPYGVAHGAVKEGTSFYLVDEPGGTGTTLTGINDTAQFVGSFTPTGLTVPEPIKGH